MSPESMAGVLAGGSVLAVLLAVLLVLFPVILLLFMVQVDSRLYSILRELRKINAREGDIESRAQPGRVSPVSIVIGLALVLLALFLFLRS